MDGSVWHVNDALRKMNETIRAYSYLCRGLGCTIKTAAEVRLFRRTVVMDTAEGEVMEVVMLDMVDAVPLAEVVTADAVVTVEAVVEEIEAVEVVDIKEVIAVEEEVAAEAEMEIGVVPTPVVGT